MSFLGRAMVMGSRFLGAAARGSRYIGRALPVVSRGLGTAAQLASNPLVQSAGRRVGIDPSVFRGLASGMTNVGNGLAMVPDAARSVAGAAAGVRAAVQPAKRSLADLYAATRGAA
ncbi:hypothetical protein JKP88DRAFT_289981 [Tribonema minus]|uniref:Uncharacterized protein n=1 Tax=Tribonema minus TaxID=303371 RepID=A0A835Z6P0_9STRA|nr:hypothetical protein JKP88DRAFT_289981 [Tribonema minus]